VRRRGSEDMVERGRGEIEGGSDEEGGESEREQGS
jgi:hypothetical protein